MSVVLAVCAHPAAANEQSKIKTAHPTRDETVARRRLFIGSPCAVQQMVSIMGKAEEIRHSVLINLTDGGNMIEPSIRNNLLSPITTFQRTS